MSLLDTILEAQGGAVVGRLAKQFGVGENQIGEVLGQLVPALAGGVKKNINQPGGLDSLVDALKRGNHGRYLDDLNHIGEQATVDDGDGILGHIFGNKDVSREVARRTQTKTGVSASILKKMLPVIATLVMGGLNKRSRGGSAINDMLGGGNARQASSGGLQNILTSFLDKDGDGSMVDDLLGSLLKR